MHDSVFAYIKNTVLHADVEGKRVLEVGSYNCNGSIRPYIESLWPKEYIGVDIREGDSVDRIVNCEHLVDELGDDWDLVVCCESLANMRDWRTCAIQMATAVKVGGKLVITTRSPGFPYRPEPEDHWRFTGEDMTLILTALRMGTIRVYRDPQETHPGVFASCRKHKIWKPPSVQTMNDIRVKPADQPQAKTEVFNMNANTWCVEGAPVNAREPLSITGTYDERPDRPTPEPARKRLG